MKKGQGTGAIHSANVLLWNDSCPHPSSKSCVWEDNRLAKVRNELLLNKSQERGLRSSSVTCQGSIFNLLLGALELNVFCPWQQTGGTQCTSWLVQPERDEGWLEHFRVLFLGRNTRAPRKTNLLSIFMSL